MKSDLHDTCIICSCINLFALILCLDIHSLCQFLRGKHRLAEIGLVAMPIMVVEAALSAESSTMKELEWIHTLLVSTYIHVLRTVLGQFCTRKTF